MTPPRVLLVLSSPPHAEGRAAGKSSLALVRGLVALGVDAHAVAAGWPGTEGLVPPAELPVEVVPVAPELGGPSRWLDRIRRPRGHLAAGAFGARVRELAASGSYDVVFGDEVDAVWCAADLAVPSALHVHYLLAEDRPLGSPWTHEFRSGVEFALAERAAVRRYRDLVASSPVVAAALRRRGATTVHETVLGLDEAAYGDTAILGEPVAGLIGTAGWAPTNGAVEALLRLWPRIGARVPDASLRIAGRGIGAVAGAAAASVPGRVCVEDEVAHAVTFVQELGVLAYPLVRGSGTKVKVLEAMASGVPVVTTAPGAEGIVPNDGVVVAADDDGFVASTAELLADVEARRQRGAAAREAFLAHHSSVPVGQAVLDALVEVVR